jgi:branched-chain amino acid transport system substrate-binding protein
MMQKFICVSAFFIGTGLATSAFAGNALGETDTEIKIGSVFPFSGHASSLGLTGKGVIAYIQSINDRGGINNRKINYVALDDSYSPPKAVEQVRKLVESDEVAFAQLGTPSNTATSKYLKAKKVPSIAVVTGSSKFTNVDDYPLFTTCLASYELEGKILGKYVNKTQPNAKVAVLWQNDDLGKDYLAAFKSQLGPDADKRLVTASHEVSEPTVDSQVVSLWYSGAEVFFIAGTPKFAAQAIRKAAEIGRKPLVLLDFPAASIGGRLRPAGLDNAVGVTIATMAKDPTDKRWDDDEGIKAYRAFFEKYIPGGDVSNTSYLTGYKLGMVLEQILKQCGNELSRENIVRQSMLKDFVLPTAAPGIKINTSDKVNMIWTQMIMQRWSGSNRKPFGEALDANAD